MAGGARIRWRVEVHGPQDLDTLGWPCADEAEAWHMHAFQTREFLRAWRASVGPARGARLCLVVVRDGAGAPVLFVPLSVERVAAFRVLRFADGGVADYNAPILRRGRALDGDALRALWPRILDALPRVDAVDLRKMPETVAGARNPMLALGARLSGEFGSRVRAGAAREAYLADPARAPVVNQALRKARRLERGGELALCLETPEGERERVLDFLLRQKRAQYRATTGRDGFARGLGAFYAALARAPATDSGFVLLSHLAVDGRIAAAHLGFLAGGRAYYILPADDREGFARHSVGTILLKANLEHFLFERGLDFDFGHGGEGYKTAWRTEIAPLHDYAAARTWLGALYPAARALWLKAREGARRRAGAGR